MPVLLVLSAGLGVGALLGALGAGGSVLAVPILVNLMGEDVATAASTSLLVVGATAAAGALSHAAAGTVRRGPAFAVAAAAAAGAVGGTFIRTLVPPRTFLVAFAGLLVVAAFLLARPPRPSRAAPEGCATGGACGKAGVTGAGVGVLTGLFGVGGGFLVVPALTLLLRYPAREAVGTSLVVVAVASGASLLASFASAPPDWAVAVPFALAGVAGAAAGRRLGARLPEAAIRRAFAGALVLLAVVLAVKNVVPHSP